MSEIDTTLKLPLPEQIIAGRYRIVRRLGAGGMGLVFLAEQLGVGHRVALKFLDPEPSEDEARLERFLQEAKVGIAVQHPNATRVLDLGQDEAGRLFVAFEHVEGEDLREVLKREGRLRFSEARAIALQVAQVLAFAHERGIVHRDIKPENIRVRRDLGMTHVKLLDFGIARLLKKSGVRLTAEGSLAGTPRYMSPEQVNDEAIDGRVDQYALGLVLYEMLTGAVAIGGKNVTQILVHQLQTLVPPLAWADPELGHAVVDAFIARATAKARDDRFPSMAEFITALQSLQVDERAWPPPRAGLPGPVGSSEPTKDGVEKPASGLSDTFVRPRVTTDPEPRLAVNRDLREPRTEPMVKAVARPEPATRPTRAAATPSGGESKPPGATTPGGEPVQLRPSRVIELPTDPERPAVLRAPVRLTVRGDVKPAPPAPAQRGRAWPWALTGLALLSVLVAVAVWWQRTH